MKALDKLNQEEKDLLLKAPALVSLLAASIDGVVDKEERKGAIHLSHLRTFTSVDILQDYYKEVEKTFASDFDHLNRSLPKGIEERKEAINVELGKLNSTYKKLDKGFVRNLQKSLKTYADHVSKIHRNALAYFLLPGMFPGVTD